MAQQILRDCLRNWFLSIFRFFKADFRLFFRGLYQLCVYYPLKKSRKSAKIIQKLDETQIRRQSLIHIKNLLSKYKILS